MRPFPAPPVDRTWITGGPGTGVRSSPWMTLPPYAEAGGSVAGEKPVIWTFELYVTAVRPQGRPDQTRGVRGERSVRTTVHRLRDGRV